MDAKEQRLAVVRPPGIAVGAHGHALGERGVRARIVRDLLTRRTERVPEAENHVALVAQAPVFGAFEHGEGISRLAPREALVGGRAAVERRHRAARHVAELHAVTGFVLRVDGPGERLPILREREVADVADIELHSARELAEDQVGTLRAIRRARGR